MVMMYNRSSTAEIVDDMRLDMLAQKQRPYNAIPSTWIALMQHVKHKSSLSGSTVSQQEFRLHPKRVGPRKEICGRLFDNIRRIRRATSS